MKALNRRDRRNLRRGLGFLAPNILGFLAFTLFPLVFSIVMAFSNWDLRYHNMFKDTPLRFGIDNFLQLLRNPDFWQFLGNTLFLMISIPFSVAGSLLLAMLLVKDFAKEAGIVRMRLIAGGVLVTSCALLVLTGMGASAMIMVFVGVAGLMFIGGSLGGSTVYRTFFYLPHFTAGVATFILWKKIYSPHTGPVNAFLAPVLEVLSAVINQVPAELVRLGFWLGLGLAALTFHWGFHRLAGLWRDGDTGTASLLIPGTILVLPVAAYWQWNTPAWSSTALVLACVISAVSVVFVFRQGQILPCERDKGLGTALMLALTIMTLQFVIIGLSLVLHGLPPRAEAGLSPPNWLTDFHWAKPALMIMAFWGAVGSNSMLLYLAGLSNIPQELYEASEIDGAGRFQKFWHVTWPQLAPTTFFIVVMSVIGGLQGGFEMARTMTGGGPDGATTTLAYYIYTQGFEMGRLGYASAVAWTLFAFVFTVTMFNWRFGNRYVNE